MGEITVEIELSNTGNWLKTFHDGQLINLSTIGDKPKMSINILYGGMTGTLPIEDFTIKDNRTKEAEDVQQDVLK